MIGKTVAAIGSVLVATAAAGCLSFYEIGVETPIQAKLDVTAFQRVLVAGFVAGGSKGVDANTETTRLLRSQLRTKSSLKVIDAEVLTLADEVDKRRTKPDEAATPAAQPGQPSQAPATPDEPKIKTDQDLQAYDPIFADKEFWKKVGEEYQAPLIVTGSVLFTEVSKSGMVSKSQEYVDPTTGRQLVQEVRQWVDRKGFRLAPKWVFIDGRTGEQLFSEALSEETYYPTTQNTPALSSYFELMDKLLPGFLNTLSTQKIRGTRFLIK